MRAAEGPASVDTVAAVRDAVHEAAVTRAPLRIIGRGTWLDAGRPTAAGLRRLTLGGLRGITDYTPGDLTLTALAGTTLVEIADATSREKQWLPLDPFSAAEHGGTIGATFATASAGPLARALGSPRDLALGVQVVTGEGAVVRAGGKVVKNVAGFDLTRLITGAWGTLGVITEVTVRLRARPEVEETVAVLAGDGRRGADGADIGQAAEALAAAAVAPLAVEALNPRLASRLGIEGDGRAVILVRLGGNAERVASERAALSAIGDAAPVTPDVWTALRRCEPGPGGAAVVRWSQLASRVGETWRHVVAVSRVFPEALIHGSLGRGLVRAIIPQPEPAALAAALREADGLEPFAGSRIAERLPAQLWWTEAPTAVGDRLSRRLRGAFDPCHVLNPGLLGEPGYASDD